MTSPDQYLPSRRVRERYGVSDMTLHRWEHNPASAFPKPIRINGRRLWSLQALEAYERRLASRQTEAA